MVLTVITLCLDFRVTGWADYAGVVGGVARHGFQAVKDSAARGEGFGAERAEAVLALEFFALKFASLHRGTPLILDDVLGEFAARGPQEFGVVAAKSLKFLTDFSQERFGEFLRFCGGELAGWHVV
jgi:hypothetical protein